MQIYIIKIAILLSYYVLGAYATTDFLRLTSYGNHNPKISASDCRCPSCNHKLSMKDQIPIFAFLFNRGKCSYCKAPIPKQEFILEVSIFVVSAVACIIGKFGYAAFAFTFVFYEVAKIITIISLKTKKSGFVRSLLFSFAVNLPIFAMIFLLYSFHSYMI